MFAIWVEVWVGVSIGCWCLGVCIDRYVCFCVVVWLVVSVDGCWLEGCMDGYVDRGLVVGWMCR